jgi:hypothetical protein
MSICPNKSRQPTPINREQAAVGAGSLRSQRRHELIAPPETFAARTVVAVAEDVIIPAA